MKYLRLSLFIVVLCVISSPFAYSLSTKSLSLKQLVALSPTIAKVTLIDKKIEDDVYESNHLVTYYTFKVEECIKGDCEEETLVIKQLAQVDEGGIAFGVSGRLGLPDYKAGEHYLIFLSGDSEKTGLTSTVGFHQGLFKLKKVGGKWSIPSLSSRKRLLNNLPKQIPTKTLTSAESSLGSTSNDYETFKSVIKKLAEE